jgi:type II secretion system (T2SS) protein N
MNRFLVTVVGLLVLAATIAVFAPASLVDARIASISRGTLRVADVQGTLWRGRGVLTPPDGRWRLPVEWTLQPLPMLSGATSIAFGAPDGAAQGVRGRVEFRAGRTVTDSLVVRVPATVIASMSGPAAMQAGGDIELRSDALELAPTGSSGSVAGLWRNARLVGAGLPLVDFGTLTAKLIVRGNALAGPISSRDGSVQVSGDIAIGADRIAADLRLIPDASAAPELHKALAALGPADASGAVSVRVDRNTR